MEGEEIVVINPGTVTVGFHNFSKHGWITKWYFFIATLSDKNYFSYKDLQKLCKKLNIGGVGKREELEAKLVEWNRLRSENGAAVAFENDENAVPMNVIGHNFALMAINVKCQAANSVIKLTKNKRAKIVAEKAVAIVSPSLLRPLRADPSTPGKGILKQMKCSPMRNNNGDNRPVPQSVTKLDKITFSPFNGVKFIPNRYRYDSGDDEDEEEEDEYYEQEEDDRYNQLYSDGEPQEEGGEYYDEEDDDYYEPSYEEIIYDNVDRNQNNFEQEVL